MLRSTLPCYCSLIEQLETQVFSGSEAIVDGMPDKVFFFKDLNFSLLKAQPSIEYGVRFHTDSDGKTFAQCNEQILAEMRKLRAELFNLLDQIQQIEMWIKLNIPRVSDQKHTPTQVKEDILDMLSSGRYAATSALDSVTKYHLQRAKLIEKRLKYPEVSDYEDAIMELDRKEYQSLITMSLDMRNNFSIICPSFHSTFIFSFGFFFCFRFNDHQEFQASEIVSNQRRVHVDGVLDQSTMHDSLQNDLASFDLHSKHSLLDQRQ